MCLDLKVFSIVEYMKQVVEYYVQYDNICVKTLHHVHHICISKYVSTIAQKSGWMTLILREVTKESEVRVGRRS